MTIEQLTSKRFGLLRVSSTLSLGTIPAIPVAQAMSKSRLLSGNLLQRETVIAVRFVQCILQAQNTRVYFTENEHSNNSAPLTRLINGGIGPPNRTREISQAHCFRFRSVGKVSRAVLVIDDNPMLARSIEVYLRQRGYEVQVALNGDLGLAALGSFKPDFVLVGFQVSGRSGVEILNRITASRSQLKVIVITGQGGDHLAVDAIRAGAYDFLSEPLSLAKLELLLDKAAAEERLEGTLAYFQGRQAEQSGLSKLLGDSPSMQAVKTRIRQYIDAERRLGEGPPPAVLITGEIGSGKRLVARAFHFDGLRKDRPFIEINCASLPRDRMEAALFGFERGAFPNARERKLGLLEMAHGGTLFLDEIGELEIGLQAKLLRVLEDRTVRRMGGLRHKHVDLRVIAATNQNLERRVANGTFREFLLYRLRMMQVELPPLRDREGDIVQLAEKFLAYQGKRFRRSGLRFSPDATDCLLQHFWLGNVWELRNAVERAVLIARDFTIEPQDLALSTSSKPTQASTAGASDYELPDGGLDLNELEIRLVTQALCRTGWNVTGAAKLLRLTRDTLRYRIEKHGL